MLENEGRRIRRGLPHRRPGQTQPSRQQAPASTARIEVRTHRPTMPEGGSGFVDGLPVVAMTVTVYSNCVTFELSVGHPLLVGHPVLDGRGRRHAARRLGRVPPGHGLGPGVALGPRIALGPGVTVGPDIALGPGIPLRPEVALAPVVALIHGIALV